MKNTFRRFSAKFFSVTNLTYEMIAYAFFKLVNDCKLSPNDLERSRCLEAVLYCVSKYEGRNIL